MDCDISQIVTFIGMDLQGGDARVAMDAYPVGEFGIGLFGVHAIPSAFFATWIKSAYFIYDV